MTEQELIQENEKLNARLQKAVTVFADQKATIERLTAERDAAVAKTAEASKQDELFFEQQNEIETLKQEVQKRDSELQMYAKSVEQLNETIKTNEEKLEQAREVFKKQADELANNKQTIAELETAISDKEAKISSMNDERDNYKQALTQISEISSKVLEYHETM